MSEGKAIAVPTAPTRTRPIVSIDTRDFYRLLAFLRDAGQLVAGTVGLALVLAGAWLWATPPYFTVSMVMAPTPKGTIVAPLSAAEKSTLVVAGDGFDPVQRVESEPLSDFGRLITLLTSAPVASRVLETPRWAERALEQAKQRDPVVLARVLSHEVAVDLVGLTPMRRISVKTTDREAGLWLLQSLYQAADGRLRAEAVRRATVTADYLRAQLAQTTATEHRQALLDQLAQQERRLMALRVDLPFAAELLEPPSASLNADGPMPLLVLVMAALAGLVMGGALVLLRAAWRAEYAQQGTQQGVQHG